ncbi:MAG: hypothetical protein PUE47_08755, partial [Lachnospiraceae bacterium]|nr:hypothetical protein [Lachnospiraceae bacterium]
ITVQPAVPQKFTQVTVVHFIKIPPDIRNLFLQAARRKHDSAQTLRLHWLEFSPASAGSFPLCS